MAKVPSHHGDINSQVSKNEELVVELNIGREKDIPLAMLETMRGLRDEL